MIISGKYGELCNRMFTFANIIAFAAENNLNVVNPAFDEYAHYFQSISGNVLNSFPSRQLSFFKSDELRRIIFRITHYLMRFSSTCNLSPTIQIGWKCILRFDDPKMSETLDIIKQAPFVFLDGLYFLDHSNFLKYSENIRTFFRPIPQIRNKVSIHLENAKKGADILVGLHIRQGDYENFADGLYYYRTEEYVDVMGWVTELFPGSSVKFLICSNSRQEAKHFKDFSFLFGPGHFVEDLYSLASCDYIIGPPSTFSQWASFYGQVPRYVINYKCEKFYGVPFKNLRLADFRVHLCGFGKY